MVKDLTKLNLTDPMELERRAATTATPTNPVISKTFTQNYAYDETNPQDYLFRMKAKVGAGGKLSEEEQYNYLKAYNKAQETAASTPFTTTSDYYTGLEAQKQAALEKEKTADQLAYEAYKKQLEQTYATQSAEKLAAGERQKTAAQNVLSFSGFGRSTTAQNKAVEIQQQTDTAIANLQAAKDAELQRYQMKLAGASGEELQSINEQIQQYQKAANDRQIEAIKKTAEANQKAGLLGEEALSNLLETAGKTGFDMKNIEDYAIALQGMDDASKTTYLSQFDDATKALIQGYANAMPSETTGTGKNLRVWNPKTGKWEGGVSGGGAGGVGGVGGGSVGGTTPDIVLRLQRIQQAMKDNPTQARIQLATGKGQVGADFDNVVNNLTFLKLAEMRKKGFTGTLTDRDMKVLKKAATSLDRSLGQAAMDTEIKRLIEDVVGYKPATPTQPTKTTSKTGVDEALSLMQ